MSNTKNKRVEIKLKVDLDEQNLPETITWSSTDNENAEEIAVSSFLLSLWDSQYKNTLRLDLWVKNMPVDEMNRFFYETLQTLADTYKRAIGNTDVIKDFRAFNKEFALKTNLINKDNSQK